MTNFSKILNKEIKISKKEILEDYFLINESRQTSLDKSVVQGKRLNNRLILAGAGHEFFL